MNNDTLQRIEGFLFDIIGLTVPGVLAVLIFVVSNAIAPSELASSLSREAQDVYADLHWLGNSLFATASVFLILGYLIGHVVKVFSKICYSLLIIIFDDMVNTLFFYLCLWIKGIVRKRISLQWLLEQVNKIPEQVRNDVKGLFLDAGYLIKDLGRMAFVYRPRDYSDRTILTKTVNLLNEALDGEFTQDKWYPIYKMSQVILTQENITSLSRRYLAKYNLYRSVSFIFLVNLAFVLSTFSAGQDHLLKATYAVTLVIGFVTFKEKYSRYWTLCGNDTLVSVFYHLKKRGV